MAIIFAEDLENPGGLQKVQLTKEQLDQLSEADKEVIKDNPAPHRRYGTMECMYHDDEGIVNNQFQGDVEQTSKNEILYRKKMQKGEVDIDNSGLRQMKYDIHSIDTIYNRHKLINVRFK